MRSEDIDVLIGQWQRAMLKPTNDELAANVTANPDHIVSIWVAGEKSPQVLGLLKANNNAYAIYNGDLYLLDFPTLNQLLPPSD
jgi:hypothetical protein